ncbi:MAG TPA: DUF4360 domain-containing protein, partial [Polyangiales bacterium]
ERGKRMSTHLTIRTKLAAPLAALGMALALQACAEESAEREPVSPDTIGEADAETEPTPSDDQPSDAGAAAADASTPTRGQGDLDGVPLGPTPVAPPPRPPAPTDSVVPPPAPGTNLTIATVSANGTGCPRGTWTAVGTPNHGVELRLDGYAAALEGPSLTSTTRDCQLALHVGASNASLTYAIESVTYEGHATLSASASAELAIRAYFQGDATERSESSRSFRGPMDADYQFVDQLDAARTVWSPCGLDRALNLSTTLRLSSGGDAAMNRLSLGTITAVRLAVRDCSTEAANAAPGERAPTQPTADGPTIISVTRTEQP